MKILTKLIFASLLLLSTSSYSVELTPIIGYRGGGEFIDETTNEKHTLASSEIYGLIVSWPDERGRNYELYYSHQSTDLNSISVTEPSPTGTADIPLKIDYLHFGGTTPISSEKDLQTFVSGGLGLAYFSSDYSGTQSDLRASFSIGIGLRYPITEHIAFRLETRMLGTLFSNNSAIFCSGGCAIKVNGNLFMQGEVFAGIGFSF